MPSNPILADPILERLARLHPRVMDLSLSRLEKLLARMGHPERALPPTIHVAGTNGKGSTIAMLRAMYEAAGCKVHVYTSPHLVRFSERFVLAGEEIDDQALSEILLECEAVNAGEPITQFEITTAAGLLAFSRSPGDLLLLEVGLGGRFDATNVIGQPALSIITPVSMDHHQYLGDTLEAIAFEKAGILKPGTQAVIGRQSPAALTTIEEQAAATGAPLARYGLDWSVERTGTEIKFQSATMTRQLPLPCLPGAHQIDNAGIAIAAVDLLQDRFPVSTDAMAEGLRSIRWPARLQRLTHGPLCAIAEGAGCELWLDGGHNADAARVIARTVSDWQKAEPARPVGLVYGGINSRKPEDYLAFFRGQVSAVRTVTIPGEANAITAEEAAEAAQSCGLEGGASDSVEAAVRDLTQGAVRGGIILICGSLYLAGTVLAGHD